MRLVEGRVFLRESAQGIVVRHHDAGSPFHFHRRKRFRHGADFVEEAVVFGIPQEELDFVRTGATRQRGGGCPGENPGGADIWLLSEEITERLEIALRITLRLEISLLRGPFVGWLWLGPREQDFHHVGVEVLLTLGQAEINQEIRILALQKAQHLIAGREDDRELAWLKI